MNYRFITQYNSINISDRVIPILLDKLGDRTTYIEPFVGDGSMLIPLLLMNDNRINEYTCSDVNKELIITYNVIKNNVDELIKLLNVINIRCVRIDDVSDFYYHMRNVYNDVKEDNNIFKLYDFVSETMGSIGMDYSLEGVMNDYDDKDVLIAALFIALNKLGYKGLYRTNSKGKFNVPYGKKHVISLKNDSHLYTLNKLFNEKNVTFKAMNYTDTIDRWNDSIVYLNPPSYNLSNVYDTMNFNYNEFIDNIHNNGNNVVMVNSLSFKCVITDRLIDVFNNIVDINITTNNKHNRSRNIIIAY